MSKKKKLSISILAAGFLLVLFFFAVNIDDIRAYLSDGDKAENVSIVGGNRIEIIEDFDPPAEINPGTSFTKDVKVLNTGLSDCYVRIKAVFTDSDMGKYCTVDWNTADYFYDSEDGYYYYTKAIAEGEQTTSLFTTVTVSDSIPEAEIKDFDILVYAESYQAAGFASYEAAWEHYHRNKPVSSVSYESVMLSMARPDIEEAEEEAAETVVLEEIASDEEAAENESVSEGDAAAASEVSEEGEIPAESEGSETGENIAASESSEAEESPEVTEPASEEGASEGSETSEISEDEVSSENETPAEDEASESGENVEDTVLLAESEDTEPSNAGDVA